MNKPVTLVVWRDARADPPEEKGRMYHTDLGLLYLRAFAPKVEWVVLDDEGRAHVQYPRVYCEDPSPPGDDPLRLDDLRDWYRELGYRLTETDYDGDGNPAVAALRDRLRRAIEEAER